MSVHVTSWVLRESEATLGDRLVLLVLADHANDDGSSAWPSVATIAHQTRLSERQVQRCLRNLETAGEIRPAGKSKKGTNVYDLSRYQASVGGDILSPPRGDIYDTGGVTSTTQGVTPTSPDPSVEPSEVHPPGTTSAADASGALVSALEAFDYDPEKGKKVGGRNLPWDALVAETEEHGEANAVRVGRALKFIRRDAWETASAAGLTIEVAAARWEAYEHALADEITKRIRWLKSEKPDLTWGAEGVARWWTRARPEDRDARTETLVDETLRRMAS